VFDAVAADGVAADAQARVGVDAWAARDGDLLCDGAAGDPHDAAVGLDTCLHCGIDCCSH
jgi:hypothetical protein